MQNIISILNSNPKATEHIREKIDGEFEIQLVPHAARFSVPQDNSWGDLLIIPCGPQAHPREILSVVEQATLDRRLAVLVTLSLEELNLWADLYGGWVECLVLPSSREEIIFRIKKAISTQRMVQEMPQVITMENLKVNLESKKVWVSGTEIHLLKKEYNLLVELLKERGSVVGHGHLNQALWPMTTVSAGNLPTQVYNLKRKLADFSGEIITVHGIGVMISRKDS